jgi:hypothetical protein
VTDPLIHALAQTVIGRKKIHSMSRPRFAAPVVPAVLAVLVVLVVLAFLAVPAVPAVPAVLAVLAILPYHVYEIAYGRRPSMGL